MKPRLNFNLKSMFDKLLSRNAVLTDQKETHTIPKVISILRTLIKHFS